MAGLANLGRMLPVVLAALCTACGVGSHRRGSAGPSGGSVEAAFYKAAADTGMSARMMMAVGYLESRLTPTNATADYAALTDSQETRAALGTIMTQTAFGLPLNTLGLDQAQEDSATLESQVAAYAQWLQKQFKEAGVSLSSTPNSPEEKFYWISNLAKVHRRGMDQRRNVQILFARELVQILNRGFIWQDSRNGAKLEFGKEGEPLTIEKFPINGQQWLRLITPTNSADLGVTLLPLATVSAGSSINRPKRVTVIHCPLSLSACLEMQTRSKDSEAKLAAHYVIPAIYPNDALPDPVLNGIFQVADLSQSLTITNASGQDQLITDAVVIMLVGNSGRMISGSRQPAIPTWFTDGQLRGMAQIVNNVCTSLAQNDGSVKRDECISNSAANGVQFRRQNSNQQYSWGDIADYDETIFHAYLTNPGGLSTDVQFDLASSGRFFSAGDSMALTVLFDSSARTLELERLNRCPNGGVVWEPVRISQVRNQTRATLTEALHDSGPNRNGEQYFRLRLYGGDGHLVGWTVGNVLLRNYETEPAFASDKYCKATY